MDVTTNYNLSLPDYSDVMDVKVLDENFTTLDTEVKAVDTKLSAKIAAIAEEVTKIKAAISGTNVWTELYLTVSDSAVITDLSVDNAANVSIDYNEFKSAGGNESTDIYGEIYYIKGTAGQPESSNTRIFFRTVAADVGDGSEVTNSQYLLYSDGTIYKRDRLIWTLSGGIMSGWFGDWYIVDTPNYSVFTATTNIGATN